MTRWVFAKTSVWPNRYVLLHKYILQRPKLFKLKDFVETLHHYTVFQKLVLLVFNPLKLTFCSIYIVVFPSAWRFFGIGSFCNFWYVLETHITLCVTEPDFWKKLFWFFICWYKYRKAKSYFDVFFAVIVKKMWLFSCYDSNIYCNSKGRWWIELCFCMLIQIQKI